jgi:hypothetical protein
MIEQLAKKEWTEPELIVLVRNKPEEAVLNGCKGLTKGTDWDSTKAPARTAA